MASLRSHEEGLTIARIEHGMMHDVAEEVGPIDTLAFAGRNAVEEPRPFACPNQEQHPPVVAGARWVMRYKPTLASLAIPGRALHRQPLLGPQTNVTLRALAT